MLKKLLISMLMFTLLFSIIPIQSFAAGVSVEINEKGVSYTLPSGEPFIDSANRVQVPFRQTLEAFGAQVSWDSKNQTAIAEKNGIIVKVPIGSEFIYRDNETIVNDTKAIIKDGRTYLPIRVVLESFGANVSWDSTSHSVRVSFGSVVDQNSSLYNFDESTGTIVEYLASSYSESDYIIPEKINDIAVTCIGPEAFYTSEMKTIRIPQTITKIELPSTSSNGKTFGFMLDNIYVDGRNQYYSSTNGVLFNKAKTELLWYGEHRTDSTYYVPDGTMTIKKQAFWRNDDLQIIYIPASVKEINPDAFYNCTKLKEINVSPDNMAYYSKNGILYKSNGEKVSLYGCWDYPESSEGSEQNDIDYTDLFTLNVSSLNINVGETKEITITYSGKYNDIRFSCVDETKNIVDLSWSNWSNNKTKCIVKGLHSGGTTIWIYINEYPAYMTSVSVTVQ